MIQSSQMMGHMIRSALTRTGMLAIGKYALSIPQLLRLLDDTVRENAVRNFQTDKENYYDSRPILATVNGKFAATGNFDSATNLLSFTMTIGGASLNDIGKIVTFFDNTPPFYMYAGVIANFFDGAPQKYLLSLLYPIPTIASAINITIGDWLPKGNVIRLIQPNEILSPEHLILFDLTNSEVVDIVFYDEFDRRSSKLLYKTSTKKWARYQAGLIEIASGSAAPTLGTVRVSANWMPPRSAQLDFPIYAPEKRLGQIEDEFIKKLMSIKVGQPVAESSVQAAELTTLPIQSEETRIQKEKVH